MSLTTQDLHAIRKIVDEETRAVVQAETPFIVEDKLSREIAPISIKLTNLLDKIDELGGRVEALENDVKEIYGMITEIQKMLLPEKEFKKFSIEQKLLKLNRELLAAAKEAGITLPRS
jgi:hypothetical protein